MKNIYLIIFFTISTALYSQQIIDTSKIKSIRKEWRIEQKSNDSILTEILTEYNSGIFKEEYPNLENGKTFGNYLIFNSDNINRDLKAFFQFYVMEMGDVYWKNHFDKSGNIDSINKKLQKNDSLIVWNFNIEKKYKNKKKGKLDYFINEEGKKDVYYYDIFGKLKKIIRYKGSEIYRIRKFRNDLLVSELYPQRSSLQNEFTYLYDEKKRLIKKEEDYYFYSFKYNEFGIESIEKILKKNNNRVGLETFEYNPNGKLSIKKEFINDKLMNIYSYSYQ